VELVDSSADDRILRRELADAQAGVEVVEDRPARKFRLLAQDLVAPCLELGRRVLTKPFPRDLVFGMDTWAMTPDGSFAPERPRALLELTPPHCLLSVSLKTSPYRAEQIHGHGSLTGVAAEPGSPEIR